MIRVFAFFLIVSSFIACKKEPQASGPFSLSQQKLLVLEKDSLAWFQYWEIKDQPYLWEAATQPVEALQAFRDTMSLVMGQDILDSVIKNRHIQQKVGDTINQDSLSNRDLVLKKQLGKARTINTLEAAILDYQLTRYPLYSHPTEFHGFIAKHGSLGLVRVYYGASDAPWPPKPYVIIDHLEEAMKQGWHLAYHLHNHYEADTNRFLGILAPSKADAHYFKMLRDEFDLPTALITNGFHTVELDSMYFSFFNSY